VKVRDDYYSGTSVKIRKGQKVKWTWGNTNFNPHDVTLKRGPKGVKKRKFRSLTASIGYSWTRKFKVKGAYNFWCTIHPTVMRMKVTVRK
jgi:plastocyanin